MLSCVWSLNNLMRPRVEEKRDSNDAIRNTKYAIRNTHLKRLAQLFRSLLADFTSQRHHAVCSKCCYLDDGAG
jgi:hypothetical protein